jgi:membrane-bound lytic murein transglycosylase F
MEYNSISYFIYRGQRFGFEYELMQEFAKSIGVKLEIVVAHSSDDQFNLLNEGKGDIIANGLLSNDKIKQKANFTVPYRNIEQVIVQRKTGKYFNATDSTYKNDSTITSTNQLADTKLYTLPKILSIIID